MALLASFKVRNSAQLTRITEVLNSFPIEFGVHFEKRFVDVHLVEVCVLRNASLQLFVLLFEVIPFTFELLEFFFGLLEPPSFSRFFIHKGVEDLSSVVFLGLQPQYFLLSTLSLFSFKKWFFSELAHRTFQIFLFLLDRVQLALHILAVERLTFQLEVSLGSIGDFLPQTFNFSLQSLGIVLALSMRIFFAFEFVFLFCEGSLDVADLHVFLLKLSE